MEALTSRLGQQNLGIFNANDFGGGLNKGVNSFQLADNELREATNIKFGLKGSMGPRLGRVRYDDGPSSGDLIAAGSIKAMHRYVKTDGHREVVAQAGSSIFRDGNIGGFGSAIGTTSPGNDGYASFAQWRNTVYFGSNNAAWQRYNKGTTAEVLSVWQSPEYSSLGFFENLKNVSGQLDSSKYYAYRFTLSLFHGDDFMGETSPVETGNIDGNYYQEVDDGHTGNELKRRYTTPDIPTTYKWINVYRTQGLDATVNAWDRDVFHFMGQISVEDYNAKSPDEVVFTDTGDTAVESAPVLVYNKESMPQARFLVPHKNRMWALATNDYPWRVWPSEYLEPEIFFPSVAYDIEAGDGEWITGGLSWRNKALLVFKPNSISGIFGGDEELTRGIPDAQIEYVDENVGCIAPRSLSYAKGGYIFLSNEGVMVLSGSGVEPLDTKKINPILDTIPADRRAQAAGIYVNRDQKYMLAISEGGTDSVKNSVVLEYDFFTHTWTRHETGPFSSFIEFRRNDEKSKVIGAVDNSQLIRTSAGVAHALDEGAEEMVPGVGLPWTASTKFFDCGYPSVKKNFTAAKFRVKTAQAIAVAWSVDDGRVTGTLGGSGIVPDSTYTWDADDLSWQGSPPEDAAFVWGSIIQGTKVFNLPEKAVGHRISFTFSGTSKVPGTEIQGITMYYTPIKGLEE